LEKPRVGEGAAENAVLLTRRENAALAPYRLCVAVRMGIVSMVSFAFSIGYPTWMERSGI
jgi:hypothetical protein